MAPHKNRDREVLPYALVIKKTKSKNGSRKGANVHDESIREARQWKFEFANWFANNSCLEALISCDRCIYTTSPEHYDFDHQDGYCPRRQHISDGAKGDTVDLALLYHSVADAIRTYSLKSFRNMEALYDMMFIPFMPKNPIHMAASKNCTVPKLFLFHHCPTQISAHSKLKFVVGISVDFEAEAAVYVHVNRQNQPFETFLEEWVDRWHIHQTWTYGSCTYYCSVLYKQYEWYAWQMDNEIVKERYGINNNAVQRRDGSANPETCRYTAPKYFSNLPAEIKREIFKFFDHCNVYCPFRWNANRDETLNTLLDLRVLNKASCQIASRMIYSEARLLFSHPETWHDFVVLLGGRIHMLRKTCSDFEYLRFDPCQEALVFARFLGALSLNELTLDFDWEWVSLEVSTQCCNEEDENYGCMTAFVRWYVEFVSTHLFQRVDVAIKVNGVVPEYLRDKFDNLFKQRFKPRTHNPDDEDIPDASIFYEPELEGPNVALPFPCECKESDSNLNPQSKGI
ncbi:hypothetical protein BDY21DRAFT_366610 [Lineolata rhizophorae]|uniref:Uncharacterized protein n=1 Tax=Lineolata rhizophorae TaxID=578093 RepID=A0A6A6NQ43_9PEZI|nr:hypothetical protein BDY21DRAFT_366610 [Lineolata rhizophorae]